MHLRHRGSVRLCRRVDRAAPRSQAAFRRGRDVLRARGLTPEQRQHAAPHRTKQKHALSFIISTDPQSDVARARSWAAIYVQDFDAPCVLQFAWISALCCALHRSTSLVIHRSGSYLLRQCYQHRCCLRPHSAALTTNLSLSLSYPALRKRIREKRKEKERKIESTVRQSESHIFSNEHSYEDGFCVCSPDASECAELNALECRVRWAYKL